MITYSKEMVKSALKEVCDKFEVTKQFKIKKITYVDSEQYYRIIIQDDSQHIIYKELLNRYIESLGEKGTREIAACLLHSIELEESATTETSSGTDEVWDGDMQDVIDYQTKHKNKDDVSGDVEYHDEEDRF
ncbi:hypothetical protein ACFL1E_07690 [Candidatus Omnitrophota bacterium]